MTLDVRRKANMSVVIVAYLNRTSFSVILGGQYRRHFGEALLEN